MIINRLEQIWIEAHAWPGFFKAMHALLSGFSPKSPQGIQRLEQLAAFPGLCCQAAGGEASWADDLATAWLVFFGAAYIMDSVEDGDPPAPEWAWLTPGMTVNAASGLYFSASILFSNLRKAPLLEGVADEVITAFYQGFLRMSAGQHRDLSGTSFTLDDYWEIAKSKSGAFFAIASRCGAHLATRDPERLKAFHDFGVQLGLLIQILDDIDDIQKAPTSESWVNLGKSLPVIYSMKTADPKVKTRLEILLRSSPPSREAGEELLDLIDEIGVTQFLINQFEYQRERAIEALHQAKTTAQHEEKLVAFLPHIY